MQQLISVKIKLELINTFFGRFIKKKIISNVPTLISLIHNWCLQGYVLFQKN